MSAKMLTDKGRCCNSRCIHCPYGHTIKMESLKFYDYTPELENFYQFLKDQNISNFSDYKVMTLKDIIIGFIKVDHLFVLDMQLRPEFTEQNISKELVESYYFY